MSGPVKSGAFRTLSLKGRVSPAAAGADHSIRCLDREREKLKPIHK